MDVYAKSNLYKFLERKKNREKLAQRFPSFFKRDTYFVYFLLFCTTCAPAITNAYFKRVQLEYNTKMKFPKFQKHFSFLKPFEFPLKDISKKKKKHHIIYTHILKHDISSKRLPYVYASRITRPFSISLAMAENKG